MNEIEKLKAKDTETALMICSDAAKQADMFHIAETMADAADCIEQLLKEIERLQKYERSLYLTFVMAECSPPLIMAFS